MQRCRENLLREDEGLLISTVCLSIHLFGRLSHRSSEINFFYTDTQLSIALFLVVCCCLFRLATTLRVGIYTIDATEYVGRIDPTPFSRCLPPHSLPVVYWGFLTHFTCRVLVLSLVGCHLLLRPPTHHRRRPCCGLVCVAGWLFLVSFQTIQDEDPFIPPP